MLLLCSCAAKKKIAATPEQIAPSWQTVSVTNTLLAVEVDGQTYEVNCKMQAVRDSMLVISVMPMMNMEVVRFEISPKEGRIIDKMNRRYVHFDLSAAQKLAVPNIRWSDIQDFVAGDGLQPGQTMSLGYTYQGHALKLTVTYGVIAYDAPVNVRNINLDRYELMDLATLLQ